MYRAAEQSREPVYAAALRSPFPGTSSQPFEHFHRHRFTCLRRPHPFSLQPCFPRKTSSLPCPNGRYQPHQEDLPAKHRRERYFACHASHPSPCFSDFRTSHPPSQHRSTPRLRPLVHSPLGTPRLQRKCLLPFRGAPYSADMVDRCYWWIDLYRFVPLWIHSCLFCQARKTSRQTVRWPVLNTPLPNAPGLAVGVDVFGPLPLTIRGNSHILLITDRLSRPDMFAVTATAFTAKGAANIFVNRCITAWGCPATLISDKGLHYL